MNIVGYALLIVHCLGGSTICDTQAFREELYTSQYACEDDRLRNIGFYSADELVCAEVRR